MRSVELLSIEVVTDDETGIWQKGELDYSLNLDNLDDYLRPDPKVRRTQLADRLHRLADYIELTYRIKEALCQKNSD